MSGQLKLFKRIVNDDILFSLTCSDPNHEEHGDAVVFADGFVIVRADRYLIEFGTLVGAAVDTSLWVRDIGRRTANAIAESYVATIRQWHEAGFFLDPDEDEGDRVLN